MGEYRVNALCFNVAEQLVLNTYTKEARIWVHKRIRRRKKVGMARKRYEHVPWNIC